MNSIKEFLKPNRWKIGILLFICIYAVFSLSVYDLGKHYRTLEDIIFGLPFVLLDLFKSLFEAPLTNNDVIRIPNVLDVVTVSEGLKRLATILPVLIIYWYLVACFIYFIFAKIKEVVVSRQKSKSL